MTTKHKKKTFDCVEMKNSIQRELQDEYKSRKDEFVSYADFINATAEESEEIRAFFERISAVKS